MYPQYAPQPDPMRIFLYGFFFGFIFASVLFFKFFDRAPVASKKEEQPAPVQMQQKPSEPQALAQVPTPMPTPTESINPPEKPNQYNYGEAPPVDPDSRYNARVVDALFLREQPDIESPTIRRLVVQELVQVVAQTKEQMVLRPHNESYPVQAHWYKIQAAKDGRVGWVFGSALVPRSE
jgi:hypothetical protein